MGSSLKSKRLALASILVFCVSLNVGTRQHAQTRRPPRVVTGLTDVVYSVRFSPDSRTLAIARGPRDFGRVELWDAQTGVLQHVIKGFDGPVWSVSFTPDGKTLVTGSSEFHSDRIQQKPTRDRSLLAELKWWDAQTGELKKQMTLPGQDWLSVTALHSPDGKLLATVDYRSAITLSPDFGPQDRLPIAPVGRTIVYDADLKLLDAGTGEVKFKLKQGIISYQMPFFPADSSMRDFFSMFPVNQRRQPLAFSPDGRLVAAWNAHEIRLWNSATGEEVRKLKDFKGSLSAVAFSPDGRTLAAATTRFSFKKHEPIFKSEIRLCDLATGAVTQTLSLSTQSISGLVFALNGRQLLIGGLQREATHSFATLELADIQTGSLGSLLANDEGTVSSVVLSPDGGALAFQSDASTVNLVDTQTWKIKQTFDENSDSTAGPRSFSRFLLSVRRVLALAFSPDGNTVSAEIEQDGIKSWDPRTGEVKNQIAAHEDTPAMVEIAANGKTVAEVGSNESVRLWDVGSGAETLVPAPGGPTSALALSADGQIMAIGHAGRIALLNTATHKLIRTLEGPQTKVNCITFSADGRTLATAAEDGLIQTWDLAGAQIIRTIMAAGKVTALRFAPGSRTLVSAGEDGMVNLWDLQTGGLSLQLKKHTATVNAIAFSPDGALMATGGDDRTVIIWETASGKTRRRLKGHDLTVTYLAFSPDATLVASGSGNASVVLWDVQTGKLNRVLR